MASEIGVQTIQHTNGTDAMTIDSSGRVQLPAIPCCHVRLTTSNPTDTSNPYTSTGVIKFDAVDVNQGSCYSTSTGLFTCPVAGIYSAYVQVLSANTLTTDHSLMLVKNSTNYAFSYNAVDSTHVETQCSALMDCAAGDTISAHLNSGGIYISTSNPYSAFIVRLVG